MSQSLSQKWTISDAYATDSQATPPEPLKGWSIADAYEQNELSEMAAQANKDPAVLANKYTDDLNAQLAAFPKATAEQKFIAANKYIESLKDYHTKRGMSQEDVDKVANEVLNKTAIPERSYTDVAADLGKHFMAGMGNLSADTIAAFSPDSWLHKQFKDTAQAWAGSYSDADRIGQLVAEQQYQDDIAKGKNEAMATAKMLWNNPSQIANMVVENLPQIGLALGTGGIGLGAVNAAASAGSYRNEVAEAWDGLSKEEALARPEIQSRMQQGMSFEQAFADARTDFSDNIYGITRAAAIGGVDALNPLGKLGKGLNQGVLKTFGKEVATEAAQEAAQQINENYGVGSIDGKTSLTDNVQRAAVTGTVVGTPFGAVAAVDAYQNRNQIEANEKAVDDVFINSDTSSTEQSQPNTPQPQAADQKILESVLSRYKSSVDETEYQSMFDELEQDIENGKLQERANDNDDPQYRDFARAYLSATGQNANVEQAVETSQNFANQSTQEEEQTGNDEARYSFAGRNAKTANHSLLTQAESDLASGKDPETVRQETGWFKGTDGKMRFEIDDSQTEFIGKQALETLAEQDAGMVMTPIQDVIQHHSLFEAYPKLADIEVVYEATSEANGELLHGAWFDPQHNQIVLGNGLDEQQLKSALLHELQHVIQTEENLAFGASSKDTDYRKSAGEVEARNVQTRMNLTAEERLNRSPESTEDVRREKQIVRYADGAIANSLNENPNSDFARAVDDVFNSDNRSIREEWIELGTTPEPLIRAGIDDLPMFINKQKIGKIKNEHPEMTADLLRQIPKQLNNPVAIFKNTKGKPNSYVILTELKVKSGELVIAALHANRTNNGLEFHKLASSYGKDDTSTYLKNMVEKSDVRFVDKQKVRELQDTLQLLAPETLNALFDKASVVKNVEESNTNSQTTDTEIEQARTVLRQALGEHADKIEIIRTADLDQRDSHYQDKATAEGWFQNGKLQINLDNIASGNVLDKNQRLIWVAWHELAHSGVAVRYAPILKNVLTSARKHAVVASLAHRIQTERQREGSPISDEIATEEAIVELFAAQETGNWAELESRYNTKIHRSWKDGTGGLDKHLSFIARLFKRVVSLVTGKNINDHSDKDLFDILAGIKQGIEGNQGNDGADVRFSHANEALSETAYNQAKEAGETELTFQQWKQVRSPEFKRWFGDWENDPENASKVINPKTGEPLVVYHGTGSEFYTFDKTLQGIYFDQATLGFYFTNAKEPNIKEGFYYGSTAKEYAQNTKTSTPTIQSVFLNIRKPYKVRSDNLYNQVTALDNAREQIKPLLDEGKFDGAISYAEDTNKYGNERIYVVPESNQIKSATDNNGEFSAENEDIRFSRVALRSNNEKSHSLLTSFGLQSPMEKSMNGSSVSNVLSQSNIVNGENTDNAKFSRRPKSESLEILRKAETIRITGKEIEPSDDLRQYKRNALEYGKSLRGTYVNKDTGREIKLGLGAIKEVLQHDYKNQNHLQSVAAIPQIIENAIYVDTVQNEDVGKNPQIESYEYYLSGLNVGGVDYTVRAVIANADTGERYYDHKLSRIEKGELLSTAGITNPSSENNSPLSKIDDKRLLQILQDENAENTDDIRFSRKQSVEDLTTTGTAKDDETSLIQDLVARDVDSVKSRWHKLWANLDEALADSLRPVSDWIDNLNVASEPIKARIKGRMYRAKNLRDVARSELEAKYMNPLLKGLAELGKKHNKDTLTTKRLVGFYASLRYSIIKNGQLLEADLIAFEEAKTALRDAKREGNQDAITKAARELRKAERQYLGRKEDVNNPNFGKKFEDVPFKVGTAGGWSIPEAKAYMANIEKHLPKAEIEQVLKPLYEMQKAMLELDAASGRYTESQLAQYRNDPYYVPLTGDPSMDESDSFIGGTGARSLNISKDKALKGRKLSEAEDALDAVWKSVGKTTTHYGWQPFKQELADLYTLRVEELQESGLGEKAAREQADAELGYSMRKMQGLTRSSDNVLIHKELGQYYEIELPEKVMQILKEDNVERAQSWTRWISKPTRMMARGVTQLTYDFAPKNMFRDVWDKADMIRDKKIFDRNGNEISQNIKNKIGRSVWWNMANPSKGIWKATNKYARGKELDPNSTNEAERAMAQFVKLGGLSSFTQMIAHTEQDLIQQIKRHNSRAMAMKETVAGYVEAYNGTFDYVSSLAAFKALIDHNVDPEQAASIVLDLANFRKTGAKLKELKGFYMFLQPKMMGAAALLRSLNTQSGRRRFAVQFTASMVIYNALSMAFLSLFGDDESGNKLDTLGDITGFIPIPIPWADENSEHKFWKLHLGFGSAQLAWNMATNVSRASRGSISYTDAAVNIVSNFGKVFAPVSPSEVSASKDPIAKLVLTLTPTIGQPIAQLGFNRNAFGSPIHTTFENDGKLKAEQGRANTAQEWENLAQWVFDATGGAIDMYPESYKHLVEGYSLPLGSLREALNIFIENPNREKLGKTERPVLARSMVGNTNEFSVSRDFYQAMEEAGQTYKAYKRFKENGKLADWQTPEKIQEVRFYELADKRTRELRTEKSKRTKSLRDGKITQEAYDLWIRNVYTPQTDKVQRAFVHKWRREHGLDTTLTKGVPHL